ncbi:carbohydrate esterase family 5 protein [Biscogniauxia mediterranea]|nr:carbohydrate esterase family 5 protein [Biscogniauxia mediterranea]
MATKFLICATALFLRASSAKPVGRMSLAERQDACEAVHVFIARGSTEPYPGSQLALVEGICEGTSGCGYEDIIYPATLENYCISAGTGVSNGIAQIKAYSEACPDSSLVLTGYSQGAHVIGDILGGGGGLFADCTQAGVEGLSPDEAPGNKIIATFFGDVRHVGNQTYNTGTGASANGIYPRTDAQMASLNRFSQQIRSWCFAEDPVCALGLNPVMHLAYFDESIDEAAAWVKSQL